jgi:hypothetical protein
MSPVCSLQENPPQRVCDLIDHTSCVWNRQVVDRYFSPMDKELIYNISLSTRAQEDFWSWHYERTGVFSVRSAYRMLITQVERRMAWIEHAASRSDTSGERNEWDKLWRTQVPSKIRVFLWRLAKQSIPTGDVLHQQYGTHWQLRYVWAAGFLASFTVGMQHVKVCVGA